MQNLFCSKFPFTLLTPFFFFFFNDTATTEIYTLSLHDALPISDFRREARRAEDDAGVRSTIPDGSTRSEEHTSELQSRLHLVCRLLLEKKKKRHMTNTRGIDGSSDGGRASTGVVAEPGEHYVAD